jgi:iron complex transport system substrate-binding protein
MPWEEQTMLAGRALGGELRAREIVAQVKAEFERVDSFLTEFSQEHFRLLDQDVVVMYGPADDVLANPDVRRLDAVREERMVFLDLTDQFAGALGFASALSLTHLLDTEIETLAAGGGPATAVEQPR